MASLKAVNEDQDGIMNRHPETTDAPDRQMPPERW